MLIQQPNDISTMLSIFPTEGGDAREFELGFKFGRFSVHPDGQRIMFEGRGSGNEAEVWVLENFLPEATAGN